MKTTGVVRRIDELGRIVVPKEMRRVMRIREGDSLEIFSESDTIVLKKYSLVESINSFITQYVDAIYSSSKKEIIVTDTEKVIAASSGFKKSIVGKKIDIRLDDKIQKKVIQTFERGSSVEICEGLIINSAVVVKPIGVYGDMIGCVCVLGDNYVDDTIKMIAELTSAFVGRYLES